MKEYGVKKMEVEISILMWVDRYCEISGYEPEYEAWWRMIVAKENQASYSVEWPDVLPYLAYPHSDDIFITFHCWFKVARVYKKLTTEFFLIFSEDSIQWVY